MALRVVSGPFGEVLHVDAAKAHLNVTSSDDDALIAALVRRACAAAETFLARPLATRTFELAMNAFPGVIRLPRPPFRKLVSLSYVDDQGATQTLDGDDYDIDDADPVGGAEIVPAYGTTWPSTRDQRNAVTVRFVAGYATPFTVATATDVLTATGHPLADADLVRLQLSGGASAALPTGLAIATTYHARDVSGDTLKLAATAGGSAIDITSTGTGLFLLGEVPEDILAGVLLVLGELYERREEALVGAPIVTVPLASTRLWHPHRVPVL